MTHGTATFLKLAVFPFPVQCDVQHFDIWIQWIYFCKIVIIHLCTKFTVKICQSIEEEEDKEEGDEEEEEKEEEDKEEEDE